MLLDLYVPAAVRPSNQAFGLSMSELSSHNLQNQHMLHLMNESRNQRADGVAAMLLILNACAVLDWQCLIGCVLVAHA